MHLKTLEISRLGMTPSSVSVIVIVMSDDCSDCAARLCGESSGSWEKRKKEVSCTDDDGTGTKEKKGRREEDRR